jgi:8-oxo-dGTP pyrophosphatase MutT (NUDIX family)
MRKDDLSVADAELPKDAAGARNPFEEGFEPAVARPAATILLLRRGGKHADRKLEVLLVKRNEGARFMPGVWVFPGGRVEADELITGVSGAETDVDADELAHRAAAIRELAEEATIQLDLSAELLPWSRWITPEPVPIRFDTRFYLALAPAHSPPKADGQEVTDAAWMNPQEALERGEAGEIELVFPTIKQLESLMHFATADEAMNAARELVVEPIMPNVVPDDTEAGWRMLMPGDDGYLPPSV